MQTSPRLIHTHTDTRTHGHTYTQTQATAIPEGQNWPRVKKTCCVFALYWIILLLFIDVLSGSIWGNAYVSMRVYTLLGCDIVECKNANAHKSRVSYALMKMRCVMRCVHKSIITNTDEKAKTQRNHVHIAWDAVYTCSKPLPWPRVVLLIDSFHYHCSFRIEYLYYLSTSPSGFTKANTGAFVSARGTYRRSCFDFTIPVHIYPSACVSVCRRNLPTYGFVNAKLCRIS